MKLLRVNPLVAIEAVLDFVLQKLKVILGVDSVVDVHKRGKGYGEVPHPLTLWCQNVLVAVGVFFYSHITLACKGQ